MKWIIWTNWSGQKWTLKRYAIMYIHLTRCRMCLLSKLTWNNEFLTTIKQRLSRIYICTSLRTLKFLRSAKLSELWETSGSVQRDSSNWLLIRTLINKLCGTEFSIEIAEIVEGLVNALADDACLPSNCSWTTVSETHPSRLLPLKYVVMQLRSEGYLSWWKSVEEIHENNDINDENKCLWV